MVGRPNAVAGIYRMTARAVIKKAPMGAGRPRFGAEVLLPTTIRLNRAQREKLGRLGGGVWIRNKIDSAKDPA